MGLSASERDRLQQLAGEMTEILGGCVHSDGRPLTFTELEERCIEAGDLVTAATLQQGVRARQADQEETACCPMCDRPASRGPDEPRVLETDRGEVSWLEPSYYCRSCRRSFFPSLG